MSSQSTPTTSTPRRDAVTPAQDQLEEVTAPEEPLDEAGWCALLSQIDREEAGS